MLNFNFPEKGLELVSPPNFVHDFSKKKCYILLTDQISLTLLDCLFFFEILGNICIRNVC